EEEPQEEAEIYVWQRYTSGRDIRLAETYVLDPLYLPSLVPHEIKNCSVPKEVKRSSRELGVAT
ncbi:hypothetical protein HID58_092075, partial [Brassica napus]